MLGELLKKILQLYVDRQVIIIEDDKREALAHLLQVEGVNLNTAAIRELLCLNGNKRMSIHPVLLHNNK